MVLTIDINITNVVNLITIYSNVTGGNTYSKNPHTNNSMRKSHLKIFNQSYKTVFYPYRNIENDELWHNERFPLDVSRIPLHRYGLNDIKNYRNC